MKYISHFQLIFLVILIVGTGRHIHSRLTDLEREVFHLRTHERVLEKELNKGIHCVMCVEYSRWKLIQRTSAYNTYQNDEEEMVIVKPQHIIEK
tara:strand:+ start:190 stop:471 length:282 start_codon:yes stop_codon:yes gene_type:complete